MVSPSQLHSMENGNLLSHTVWKLGVFTLTLFTHRKIFRQIIYMCIQQLLWKKCYFHETFVKEEREGKFP